jgi:hypothetical protein
MGNSVLHSRFDLLSDDGEGERFDFYKRDIKTSAGWGLDFEDFGLYFAKQTGEKEDKWDVSFRISRSF